jgi:hypothetical protein
MHQELNKHLSAKSLHGNMLAPAPMAQLNTVIELLIARIADAENTSEK